MPMNYFCMQASWQNSKFHERKIAHGRRIDSKSLEAGWWTKLTIYNVSISGNIRGPYPAWF